MNDIAGQKHLLLARDTKKYKHMNKFWKATITFVLIVAFLVSTLVCCCVIRLAQAAVVQV